MSLPTELRIAGRSLARRPAWALAVTGTLTLGLTGAIVVGSICYGVLVRPLPYPDPGRIVRVYEVSPQGRRMNVADPNYLDLAGLPAFAALAQSQSGVVPVGIGDEPLRLGAAWVTRGFFPVFGIEPVRGRLFAPDELRPGGPPTALVSEGLWRTRLGGEPDLSKVALRIGGTEHAVVGVLPAGFDFPAGTEIWIPRELDAFLPSRSAHNFHAYGRLGADTPLAAARSQASALGRRLAHEHGDQVDLADFALVPLATSLVAGVRPSLLIELGGAAFLLLVAIVNAAALLMARLETRRRDLATRLALGARARELAIHLLAEAGLLVGVSTLASLAAASVAVGAIRRLAPEQLPRVDAIRLDAPVMAMAIAAAALTALVLAGLTARRAFGWQVDRELREGGNAILGGSRRSARGTAVALQAGASLVLLVGTALLAASLGRLLAVDPGFRGEDALVLDLYTPWPADAAAVARRAADLDRLETRLAALPGVRSAGLVSSLPISGDSGNGTFVELASPEAVPDSMEGFERLMRSGARTGDATYLVASEGYFHAMGIRLLAGRLFDGGDRVEAPHVALVSESLARTTWPGESPLGRYLEFGNMDGDVRALRVVGVVSDVRQRGLGEDPTPAIYTCFRQRPQGASAWSAVLAGGAATPAAADAARDAAHEIFPDAPTRLRTIEGVLGASLAERRLLLGLLALFAIVAVLLAGAGVFASVALTVASRRREYALRMALGAAGGDVTRTAISAGLAPVASGLAGGILVALAGSGLLRALLFGIAPRYFPAYGAAVATVALVALLAAWVPARRAAAVDPATALRAD